MRISPITRDEAKPAAQEEWDRQVQSYGRMTNMKRTLARSPIALQIYMEWYPLRDAVQAFLGEWLTLLFAHAVSAETDCLICSTYFRRYIMDQGKNPDHLELDDREQSIVDFGRQIAKDAHAINDEQFARVQRYVQADDIVTLVAFAGQMVATNLINNTLRVELDEYLLDYQKT